MNNLMNLWDNLLLSLNELIQKDFDLTTIEILSLLIIILFLVIIWGLYKLQKLEHQWQEEIIKRHKTELELKKSNQLLQTISLAQSHFIADVRFTDLFNDLLENLLNLTESEYGFIGEILYSDQGEAYVEKTHIKLRGNPYLKTHAVTNIAWNEETRKFYDENAPQGMEFHNLNTLFGAVITTGKPVIANHPSSDPRRGGLPEGHPSLDAFLGLPFYHNNQLVGMVGIANRQGGYDDNLIDYLQPFLTTCANLIKAYGNEQNRQQAEEEIKHLNQQLEKRVAQRTAELEMLFNTLPDFVFVVEHNTMQLLFCNQVFAEGIGFNHRKEVEGKTIFDCLSPEIADYFAQQNQQLFNSGNTLHLEETIALPDGDRYFDTYKVPLKNPQGEIYAILGTSRDMTDLVKTKQVLMERTTQLETTNQELDSFCYSVSHDLRAPLRHIHGFVNALKQRLLGTEVAEDPKVIHYLEVIEKSSEKMAHLIDGLLILSRVGRQELDFYDVDLNSLVKTAISMVSSEEDQINFNVGKLPTVSGDTALLQQVFINLLQNSIKFSQGRNPIQIEINSLEDGTIFVADNGVGFDMQYVDQLFGAFQRLNSQRDFEGTGIGLSIVQRIIHRHGGHIWAESVVEEGATFYFKLS
ncbi:MAG: ATP-binding protein [Crocosphaera sp.]|nr:ATP-binding protein [Crocosphaera sp.]